MELILKELLDDARSRMDKSISALVNGFRKLRTGKASPALVEDLLVETYGQSMPMKQLASISIPDPRMILINPWDKGTTKEIEKAILRSELGLNPQNDGNVIRVAIPPLSNERRGELAKIAKKQAEEGKVTIRSIRRDIIDTLKKMEKDKDISEDIRFHGEKDIQKITDDKIDKIDDYLKHKEEEILTL